MLLPVSGKRAAKGRPPHSKGYIYFAMGFGGFRGHAQHLPTAARFESGKESASGAIPSKDDEILIRIDLGLPVFKHLEVLGPDTPYVLRRTKKATPCT
jgi:hypothetical protein